MKIAIIGLGPAGVSAANELCGKGHDLMLFEARDRVGGRLKTVRDNETIFEAGGEWIDSDHRRLLGWLSKLGIEPLRSTQYPGTLLYKGEFAPEDQPWSDAQQDIDAFEAAVDMMALDLDEVPWNNVIYAEWDGMTLGEFISKIAQSDRGRWLLSAVHRSDEGEDPDQIGFLGWLHAYRNYLERTGGEMSAFRCPIGMQTLFERMLDTTKLKPHFGRILTKVEWAEDSALLHFDDHVLAVDRVVFAIPPGCLRHVNFDPPLPFELEEAILNTHISRTIKVSMKFKTKFWLTDRLSTRMVTDLPIQQIWDGTLGAQPILNMYIGGDEAWAVVQQDDPIPGLLDALCSIYPQARDSFIEGEVQDWINDPFAGGGFVHASPGWVLNHWQHLITPLGPFHFAGEHTSVAWPGFIEGALESGERVAAEILGNHVV